MQRSANSTNVETKTYLLHYQRDGENVPFYIGETVDPARRLSRHRRDAADPFTTKEAYVYLRDHGVSEFDMEVVDGVSERDLLQELTLAGHTLFNANGGIGATTKKRRTLSTFTLMNREAETKLSIKERAEASGRRNRLHSDRQNLSKSEIVRQRITGSKPTLGELTECRWNDVPIEMLGVKLAKSAERAEHCKWGDYDFFVALRKQDKHSVCVVRHRSKGERWANGATWTHCGKDRLLELLIERWDADYPGWLRPSDLYQ